MQISEIRVSMLGIPFRAAFKHASAERVATETLFVKILDGKGRVGLGESCPRGYVTGETPASALAFVNHYRGSLMAQVSDLASLHAWMHRHESVIDANPAAWCGVELALLDLIARNEGCAIESLLGLPPLSGVFQFSAVIGDGDAKHFAVHLARYRQYGFESFKIKLSPDRNRNQVKASMLRDAGIPQHKVRADANNLWPDATRAIDHLGSIDYPFWAVEEPVKPGDMVGLARIHATLGCRIILDESLLRCEDVVRLPEPLDAWVLNLRISKMGGVLRSLAVIDKARGLGLKIIVGAHVGETSLLCRTALLVANACRDTLLVQEGAFGSHLLAHDPISPSLMFASGGRLEIDSLGFPARPGWGMVEAGPDVIEAGEPS